MKKLKIAAEIIGKSLLLMVIAIAAFVAAVYAQISFQEQGATLKSISLGLITLTLFTLVTLPGLPTSYHSLICEPAERKPEDAEN